MSPPTDCACDKLWYVIKSTYKYIERQEYVGELLSQIKAEKIKMGKKSKLVEIIEKLPKDQKKDLVTALDDRNISASQICKVLARNGLKLTPDVISRYRRGALKADIHEV